MMRNSWEMGFKTPERLTNDREQINRNQYMVTIQTRKEKVVTVQENSMLKLILYPSFTQLSPP